MSTLFDRLKNKLVGTLDAGGALVGEASREEALKYELHRLQREVELRQQAAQTRLELEAAQRELPRQLEQLTRSVDHLCHLLETLQLSVVGQREVDS